MTTKTKDIRTAIRRADDKFEATYARGDAASMAELYTEDGMLLPTGSDFVQGKPAIQQFWQGVMDMGIDEAELEIAELEDHGDTAIEVGQYTLSGGGQVMDRGKYLVTLKREDGQWKLHRDIWNTSVPPEE